MNNLTNAIQSYERFKQQEQQQALKEQKENAKWYEKLGATSLQTGGAIVRGLGKAVEGVVDLGATIFGQSDWAKKDITGKYIEPEKWVGADMAWDNQFTDFINGVGESIGFMLPSIAIGIATGGTSFASQAASLGTFGVSAAGAGTEKALQEGASSREALLYGSLKGAVETGTEIVGGKMLGKVLGSSGKVFGVIGKEATETASKATAKSIIKSTLKNSVEEGTEEVIADIVDPLLQKTYKNGSYSEFFQENGGFKGLLKDFASGAVTSGILQGADIGYKSSTMGYDNYRSVNNVNQIKDLQKQAEKAYMRGNNELHDRLTQQRLDLIAQTQEYVKQIADRYEQLHKFKKFNITQGISNVLNQQANINIKQQAIQGIDTNINLDTTQNEYIPAENQINIDKTSIENANIAKENLIHELTHKYSSEKLVNEINSQIENYDAVFEEYKNKYANEIRKSTKYQNLLKQGKNINDAFNEVAKTYVAEEIASDRMNNYISNLQEMKDIINNSSKNKLQNMLYNIKNIFKNKNKPKNYKAVIKLLEDNIKAKTIETNQKNVTETDIRLKKTTKKETQAKEIALPLPDIAHEISVAKEKTSFRDMFTNLGMYWVDAQLGLEKDLATQIQSRDNNLSKKEAKYQAEILVQNIRKAPYMAETIFESGWINPETNQKELKGFKEIIKGLNKEEAKIFEYYLYNMHNIDRMTVEERFKSNIEENIVSVEKELETNLNKVSEIKKSIPKDMTKILEPIKKAIGKNKKELNALKKRLKYLKNKPVFGEEYGADYSKKQVEEILSQKNYAETFPKMAQEIYKIYDFVLKDSVNSGRISESEMQTFKEFYPHYVPTYRLIKPQSIKGLTQATTVQGMKRAYGGEETLLSIDINLKRYLHQNIKANEFNRLATQLNSQQNIEQQEDVSVDDVLENTSEELIESKNKRYSMRYYLNGKPISFDISQQAYVGLEDLANKVLVSEMFSDPINKALEKGMKVFRGSVTSWNPFFLPRNFLRDVQDALVYTKYGTRRFAKNIAKVIPEIKKNGKLYQLFKQYGGFSGSQFDFDTSILNDMPSDIVNEKGKLNKAKFKDFLKNNPMITANKIVEIIPRLAEFMSSVEYQQQKYHEVNYSQAVYDAQEITINFGKHGAGKVSKWMNTHLIPFFNAQVQGAYKTGRSFIAPRNFKQKAYFVTKVAILGFVPAIINKIIYGDDEDYDKLSNYEKDNFYLIKVGDSFVKIPKGRLIGLIGSFLNQDNKTLADNLGNAWDTLSPISGFRSIFSPITDVNTNTTWYGGTLVGTQYNNVRPKNQYDENTSIIAKGLGKIFNYSPIKIDYLIEQYTGVLGDFIVPMTSEKGMSSVGNVFTSSVKKQFLIDPDSSSGNSQRFNNYKKEIAYQANEGDLSAKAELKYLNKMYSSISDIYDKIDEIEKSNISVKEKNAQIKTIKGSINAIYSQTLKTSKLIRKALDEKTLTEENLEDNYYIAVSQVLGSEASLKLMGNDIYSKASELNELGIEYDNYLAYYLYTKGMDKGFKTEYINHMPLTRIEKYMLYLASGYSVPDNVKGKLRLEIKKSQISDEYKEKLLAKLD